ncbi:MAG: hypothetical protein ACYC0X_30385 [Pirellulaceae bacterium]
MLRHVMCLAGGLLLWGAVVGASDEPALRVASFDVDATPPLGSPVAYARVRSVADPLRAKGIVLLPGGQPPIVICVLDWIGIANGSQDWWRQDLAKAAGTIPQRVVVHAVHQHDGPRCDVSAMALFPEASRADPHFDMAFVQRVKGGVEQAIRDGIASAQTVTHVGVGKGKVEQVASNRRLLGADGKVATMRFSSSRDPQAIAAAEGVIDPYLRLVSFWHDEQPLVCLAYYATHPMSHYGQGDVSADFVGLARAAREDLSQVPHVYFTGAGGNVAAGKYNDGTPEMRPLLASRMEAGMRLAWEATAKTPLTPDQLEWRVEAVALPVARHLDATKLRAAVEHPDTPDRDRLEAASNLAWLERCQAGRRLELACLRVGPVMLLHMPGELFVEYQLAAQQMRPDVEVCMAAYGDYGPGYIGTTDAYPQGGYETSEQASRVAPEVEPILLGAMQRLLTSGSAK